MGQLNDLCSAAPSPHVVSENPLLPIETPLMETNAPKGLRLFIKREDLLPYGGGNKVRRLLHWKEMHPTCRQLSVLSDYGSHTFYTLSQMADAFDTLIFYERQCSITPYREAIRQVYSRVSTIQIVQGSLVDLWLRSQRDPRPRLGIGGSLPSAAVAYRAPMRDCLRQLQQVGVDGVPVVHVFPIASGTMADGFLQELGCARGSHHSLVGVLTGHPLSGPWLRLRYAREPRLRLLSKGVEPSAGAFDPNHGAYAWQGLLRLLPTLPQNAVVVFWVTAPSRGCGGSM